MRRIILASESKARQKLLRQVGFRVKVVKPNIKESSLLKGRCCDLVVRNALSKAENVAKRFRSGVVIAADTVVLCNRKIIGKPKNIKEAFETLKEISRGPRLVYTGLAVIDIDKNNVFTTYEKTKIYMCLLSDEQIKSYFKKAFPFNKAGSFDIQGPGAVFVERVEGCYYNVVGLPLAKLYKILKKIGIDAFHYDEGD